jgi:hypothetical protein
MSDIAINQEVLNTLLQAVANQTKDANGLQTKAPASFSTYTPLHGPGGIWTGPGLERDVITAHVRPHGLASRLPLLPTVNTNPLYGTLTGFTAAGDTQPQYACDDAEAAYAKGCTLTAKLGMFRLDSQTIDMDDVMLRLHRGDFTDLMLRGQVLGLTDLNPSDTNQSDILNVVSHSEMVTVGVNTERALTRQLWQGTVALNQGPGLDSQIATGQVDAQTNVACPAMDSDVKDFALDDVGGSGRDIVEYLSMLEFYLRYNAQTMGLDPVTWVVVMRPGLWHELSAVWPCKYNTHRCGDADLGTNSRVVIDGRENIAERDNMRNGNFIFINGNRYEVVTDVGIFEHSNVNNGSLNPGEYASSIYMVPLAITGNFPVTYREYVDYRQAATDVNFAQGRLDVWWTDNGVYSWSLTQNKWCYKFHLKTEQRVILRTPQLAGRIDNVKYTPLQHLRSAFPDSSYHYNGGVSLRANDPGYSAVWL